MSEDTITAVEVIETEYGEKIALESPFEAKDFISVLPWKEVSEEVEEHGSLREKAISRGMDEDNVALDAVSDFDFSDDLATHVSWDPDVLDNGAWMVDTDAWDEIAEYFEHCGFDVENQTNV
jgi:hypothetical protein